MEQLNKHDLFVRYYDNRMSNDEREAFEQKLSTDEELEDSYRSFATSCALLDNEAMVRHEYEVKMKLKLQATKKKYMVSLVAIISIVFISTLFLPKLTKDMPEGTKLASNNRLEKASKMKFDENLKHNFNENENKKLTAFLDEQYGSTTMGASSVVDSAALYFSNEEYNRAKDFYKKKLAYRQAQETGRIEWIYRFAYCLFKTEKYSDADAFLRFNLNEIINYIDKTEENGDENNLFCAYQSLILLVYLKSRMDDPVALKEYIGLAESYRGKGPQINGILDLELKGIIEELNSNKYHNEKE